MTFRIIGDSIEFNGHTVGFLTVQNGTLRGDVEEALNTDWEQIEQENETFQTERDELDEKIKEALDHAENDKYPSVAKIIEILS